MPVSYNLVILLMEEILHQLIGRLSHVIPLFTRIFFVPGGAGFLPSTVFLENQCPNRMSHLGLEAFQGLV